jgi:hypothetical protein
VTLTVLSVVLVVIGICVVAWNDVSVVLSSSLLGGMDKVLPKVTLVGVLLVDMEAVVPTDPLYL